VDDIKALRDHVGETDELWHVRVHWKAEPGATCLPHTVHIVSGESRAIDEASAALDGCRHKGALVRATHAEIRRTADTTNYRPPDLGYSTRRRERRSTE
jgi:hypothetical protein